VFAPADNVAGVAVYQLHHGFGIVGIVKVGFADDESRKGHGLTFGE
jgi:hypothetical protein